MADSAPGDGYYKVYEEYSKTLRTWFVAYGIGAPVLVLNNDELRRAVVVSVKWWKRVEASSAVVLQSGGPA